jgi:NAD(P) transhydrogenase subunit alpha
VNEATLILYAVYIFMLAVFVGFEVISKVPVQLHTPLMSGTNAIHGIVMLGGMLVLAEARTALLTWLGFAAVVLGAMNLFGGFVVTDRMLEMFKTKKAPGAKR